MIDSQEPARQPLPLALKGEDFFCFSLTVKPRLARVFPLACADYFLRHDLLMIFMGVWVIVNWWVWPVPDVHFRKLEAMSWNRYSPNAVERSLDESNISERGMYIRLARSHFDVVSSVNNQ